VICSFECTFCPTCARTLEDRCPNCAGALVRRPPRRTAAVTPKALIRRLHELWTSGELSGLEEVYATDFVGHFPDVEDILAEGNRLVTRYTSRGTHRGVFRGIAATGRAVTVPEIAIYRLTEGRVAEQWCLVDELGRLQQLGAPSPTEG
jgi:predicted ester cyclase